MNKPGKNAAAAKEELSRQVLVQGREISTCTLFLHDAVAARFDLGLTDHKCLDFVRNESKVTAGRLAEVTGLTTGAITAALDRLEKAGFVRREKDEADRRKVLITALPAAQKKIEPLFEGMHAAFQKQHMSYTTAQLRLISDYQTACIRILETETQKIRSHHG